MTSICSKPWRFVAPVLTLALLVMLNAACDQNGSYHAPSIAPTVLLTYPLDGSNAAALDTGISALFDRPMVALTADDFAVTGGNTILAGVVTMSFDLRTAIFTPNAPLQMDTNYTATISAGVLSTGNMALVADKVWTFSTSTSAGPSAPLVTSTSPTTNAVGVAINTSVTATFSEDMMASSITPASFTLAQGLTPIEGEITVGPANSIRFVPEAELEAGLVYTARISNTVMDLEGNQLASNYVWSFTTGLLADTEAPVVSSTNPDDEAIDTATNATVAATFNEAIDPASITSLTFTVTRGGTPVAGAVSVGSVNTAVFTPTSALLANTLYTATLSTGVKDSVGNAMAASYTWSFTTGALIDDVAPVVSSTDPAPSATGVAVNATVAATFSEAISPASVTPLTFTLTRGTTTIAGAVSVGPANTAVFTPNAALLSNNLYTATLTTGIEDLAGNALAAAYSWTFTTGTIADTTAPVVSSTVPETSAIGVAVNATVAATFSEAINPTTVTPLTFTLMRGTTAIAGTVSVGPANTATFNPTANLLGSTLHTATLTTGIKDLAGNALAATYTWTFTTGTAPDTTAPVVSSTDPASNATGVAVNANVAATFSEAVSPTSVTTLTFTLMRGTTAVAGTVSVGPVNTAVFNPTASLLGNTLHTATLTTGIKDLAGNALAATYTWTFTTGIAPDTTAPVVSSTDPATNATGVAVNATVAATFSEAVNPTTVTTLTFTLMRGATAVPGTIAVGPVNTATFTPTAALLGNTLHTATLTTGIKDLAGNALAASYSWTFTTGTAPDTTPPVVSTTSPVANATAVAVNATVAANFSEAVNPTTVTTLTFTLMRGATAVPGTIAVGPVNTATFTPNATMLDNTVYTATLSTGIKDLAGNALASAFTWSFTTGFAPDTTPPVVSSTNPLNNATAVGVNTTVAAVFSEAVNPSTVTPLTFTLMRGTTAVAGTIAIGPVNTATFTPTAALLGNTLHTATLTTGIKDLAGNALAASYTWSFTTGVAPDTTPPVVSSTVPLNNATGVAVNTTVAATFSEAINPTTVTPLTFTFMQGATAVPGSIAVGPANTVTFTPTAILSSFTVYTGTLTTGVKDLAGNALAANHVWSFTTGLTPDITAPVVSSTNPLNNATGVAVNATVAATFSEAVKPSTLTPLTFTLMRGATAVVGTVAVGPVNAATFTPTSPLLGNTLYTATLTVDIEDLAGNHLAAPFTWSFTTGVAPDTTPPVVSSTSPLNNATGVAVNATVAATFSEAVDPATITPLTFTLMRGATAVPGTIAFGPVTTTTFTPSSALLGLTVYTATLTTGVKDLAGNAMVANYAWSFTTGVAPDTTPPVIASRNPLIDATGVPTNTTVAVTFSEAMNPASITPLSFFVMNGAVLVPGTILVNPVNTATFTPTNNLLGNTLYTVTVTTDVEDLAGNNLAVQSVRSFTTGAAPDTTRPTVVSTVPIAASTGVAVNTTVAVNFSEPMDPATITPLTFTLMQGVIAVPGTISFGPLNTATFTPTNLLAGNQLHTATLTTGVKDLAGNSLLNQFDWSFTTGTAPDITPPIVSSTDPLNNAVDVVVNATIVAVFDEAMMASSITPLSFTLRRGAVNVPGTINMGPATTATFTPDDPMLGSTLYTATLSTDIKDLAGNSLANIYNWTFTTGVVPALGPAPVSLGTAGGFAILAKSGISTVPSSMIIGHIGVSPIAATGITGFALTQDPSNVFATSTQVTGQVFAANYAVPTPTNLTTAISNLETAYTDAAGRPTPDSLNLLGGAIGGQNLAPGLYKFGSSVGMSANLTLTGAAEDVWIFQISGDLTMATNVRIIMAGGAKPKNVFWQVAGLCDFGAGSHFEGILLCSTQVTFQTGSTMTGRILAQTFVALQQATITQPGN